MTRSRIQDLCVGLGVLLFVGAAWTVHWTNAHPEFARPRLAGVVPALAASPRVTLDAGLRKLREARDAGRTGDLSATDRLNGYYEKLEQADKLLTRSLSTQPLQARTLVRLAAIRRERDLPPYEIDDSFYRRLGDAAVTMAPADSSMRVRLGKLMLMTGSLDAAARYFSEGIELDSNTSRGAVAALRAHGFSAGRLLEALPRHHRVLVQLQDSFLAEGRREDYWNLLSSSLDTDLDPTLLDRYVANGLLLGRADSVLQRLERIDPHDDETVEPALAMQRSRVLTKLNRHDDAVGQASRARKLAPQEPQYIEHLGDTLFQAGNSDAAIDAFSQGISLVTRRRGSNALQARLYRKIGESEERLQRPDRAFDAYRAALGHDPAEAVAAARMAAIRAEGGR